jgi:hypothetical protein
MKFPELFYCVTEREPCDVMVVKTCLCMFKLVAVTISMHECQLYRSCGTDKMCVFPCLIAERSDQILEQ